MEEKFNETDRRTPSRAAGFSYHLKSNDRQGIAHLFVSEREQPIKAVWRNEVGQAACSAAADQRC